MADFSLVDRSMQVFERQVSERQALQPAGGWSQSERTESKRRERHARACASFRAFMEIYFPQSAFTDGYYEPAPFHYAIDEIDDSPGIHIIAGPRDCGKTVRLLLRLTWRLLAGRTRVCGTLSHDLRLSSAMMDDVSTLLTEHPRIVEDFSVELGQSSDDVFQVRTRRGETHWRFLSPFSPRRSVRGYRRMFGRPDYILADDIENLISSMEEDAVRKRIDFVRECHKSMTQMATLTWAANNFDEDCAVNVLLQQQDQNVMPSGITVHVFPAWSDTTGSIWPARFPAHSETEMREMMRTGDEAEWQGDCQQRPIPRQGDLFLRRHYSEWSVMPDDARGVLYADQNLALKSQGDTTAMTPMLYSPSAEIKYIGYARCRSYSDPNEFFDDLLALRDPRIFRLGLDGHVSQESTWTNFIRMYCRDRQISFPHVEFCRYPVDYCATNLVADWTKGRVQFPPGFADSKEGKVYLRQFFAFHSKKAKRKDDAPDSAICANELLCGTGFVKAQPKGRTPGGNIWTISISH